MIEEYIQNDLKVGQVVRVTDPHQSDTWNGMYPLPLSVIH